MFIREIQFARSIQKGKKKERLGNLKCDVVLHRVNNDYDNYRTLHDM